MRRARIHYYDRVRLGAGGYASVGSLVILKTEDSPEVCRIHGYPVWEVASIEGTSATGPQLRLEPVRAKGRAYHNPSYATQNVAPSTLRLVVPDDGVERL